jgi:hypothetical protein
MTSSVSRTNQVKQKQNRKAQQKANHMPDSEINDRVSLVSKATAQQMDVSSAVTLPLRNVSSKSTSRPAAPVFQQQTKTMYSTFPANAMKNTDLSPQQPGAPAALKKRASNVTVSAEITAATWTGGKQVQVSVQAMPSSAKKSNVPLQGSAAGASNPFQLATYPRKIPKPAAVTRHSNASIPAVVPGKAVAAAVRQSPHPDNHIRMPPPSAKGVNNLVHIIHPKQSTVQMVTQPVKVAIQTQAIKQANMVQMMPDHPVAISRSTSLSLARHSAHNVTQFPTSEERLNNIPPKKLPSVVDSSVQVSGLSLRCKCISHR